MKMARKALGLDGLARVLWAATLITLPVTSFRYFPSGEGTYVRPLSFYPLALLMLVLLVQWLRRRTAFPWAGTWTPLAAMMLATVAASIAGAIIAPPELRGQTVIGRELRAWVTLVMGILFFTAAAWMNRNEDQLRFSLQWLFAGFVLDVLWSGLQGATFYLHILPKPLVTQWQRAFSMRELIRTNRISGLAYEPSWLAGQISTLYLPWLFAWLLTRQYITRFKWVEPVLLLCAGGLLLATFSRGGLLTVGLTTILTFLLVGRSQMRAAWAWFASGLRGGRDLIWRAAVAFVIVAAAAGALLFLAQKGYIARLWQTRAETFTDFLIQNSAGSRAAYIYGALGAYGEHPWTGVGLGASGFYIYNHLPDWALTTVPDIARQLNPDNNLYPNPKNLYVRLLAETGLMGFFLFAAFQFSLLGDALIALRGRTALGQYLGIAAVFTWLALIFYNLTQDSLAIPDLWVNLGMLVGLSGAALLRPVHEQAAAAPGTA
ncbi:MAG TPA: O-antigen ligase family protein [Anaerolineales bacterium]|nr:O-antigen ligase family protein [Anaerolineales bacterium]